jgi:UDPglucose--hexose-1-phosphate uridylyltransferase
VRDCHKTGGFEMPEIRKHYFLEEYCIIASERRKRPSDFQSHLEAESGIESCPFCPGHEDMTPSAVAVYTGEGIFKDGESERIRGWKMRVVPNLFASMIPSPPPPTLEWLAMPGHGYHEVIIDSPEHEKSAFDLGEGQVNLLLEVYRDRYARSSSEEGIKYVSIFKNSGREAGATIGHIHSQVIAIPLMPPVMRREIAAISQSSFCLYCNIVSREEASERYIDGNDSWILIAPFYSQVPYETWILPRVHASNLMELSEAQMRDLSAILLGAIQNQAKLLNRPHYNLIIFQLESDYHINLRIMPATTRIAGFEKGTGICVNPVPPEQAARELRKSMEGKENRKVDESKDKKVFA